MKLLTAYVALVIVAMLTILMWPIEPKPETATEIAPGIVYRSGTYTLTLTGNECQFEDIKEALEMEGVPPAYEYRSNVPGRTVAGGCWAMGIDGDTVFTMSPSSDLSSIPLSWFTKPGAK